MGPVGFYFLLTSVDESKRKTSGIWFERRKSSARIAEPEAAILRIV